MFNFGIFNPDYGNCIYSVLSYVILLKIRKNTGYNFADFLPVYSFKRMPEIQSFSCFNFYENSSILVFCDNINFTLSRKTDIPVNDFVSDFLKIIGCNIFTFFSCYFSLKSNDSLLLKPILQKDHLQKVISMLFQHNL